MKILIFMMFLAPTIVSGQEIDTLTFYSHAFNKTKTVFIHKPDFYKYKSDSVKLPVIYLLDGQNEWFVNPILSDIKYLQYTHEIPNALVIVIPHDNRNEECAIVDLKTELPLDRFITEELDARLQEYHPNDFKIIIGHSFSASFSLYSYLKHPDYYSAVIANTPFDEMDALVKELEINSSIDKTNISVSIGGIADDKDYYHRKKYEQLKVEFPSFFNKINTFEANNSAHNSVPIIATPSILTKIFTKFSSRYSEIAKVNSDYMLINKPGTISEEMDKIEKASRIGEYFYPPEIADINGIASRYSYSGYDDYAIKVYETGIHYYPDYYEFYLSLYELLSGTDKESAIKHLNKAESLLRTIETDWDGKDNLLDEIETEKTENGM